MIEQWYFLFLFYSTLFRNLSSAFWALFEIICKDNDLREPIALTGKQNSSNAGLTKFVYWVRTDSNVLPRSVMSRNTVINKIHNSKIFFADFHFHLPTRHHLLRAGPE